MISFSSNQGFQKVFSTKNSALDFVEVVADEKELLGKFAETIQFIDPDVRLGYNSDAFDLPYIKDRATRLGVPLKIGIDGSQPKSMKIGFNNAPMIRGRIHVEL
jgi:DNA polymerase I